jgi:hypothetical protein
VATKKGKMLEITITETATEERWTLKGRLVWPWVNELRANWMKAHGAIEGRTCIVVLNELSSIDDTGERILRTMANQGAHLVASGVDMKRALKQHIFAAVCRAMSDIPANS